MPWDKNPKIALTWAPEGKHRRGQPRETWQRTGNKEREHLRFKTRRQAEVAAKDKVAWRRKINGPIFYRERKDQWWWHSKLSLPISLPSIFLQHTVLSFTDLFSMFDFPCVFPLLFSPSIILAIYIYLKICILFFLHSSKKVDHNCCQLFPLFFLSACIFCERILATFIWKCTS